MVIMVVWRGFMAKKVNPFYHVEPPSKKSSWEGDRAIFVLTVNGENVTIKTGKVTKLVKM
jgi:hypothetical protein